MILRNLVFLSFKIILGDNDFFLSHFLVCVCVCVCVGGGGVFSSEPLVTQPRAWFCHHWFPLPNLNQNRIDFKIFFLYLVSSISINSFHVSTTCALSDQRQFLCVVQLVLCFALSEKKSSLSFNRVCVSISSLQPKWVPTHRQLFIVWLNPSVKITPKLQQKWS